MLRLRSLYQSTIGKKTVMAVTGFILVVFVIGHMVGNLKVYQGLVDGHYKIDHYGEGLREFGAPFLSPMQFLWLFRAAILLAVVLHIWSAIEVTKLNWQARPDGYRKQARVASTYASRTMRWGGVLLLAFIVYHILHLTVGSAHPEFEHGSVYKNMVIGFSSWPVSIFYILAMGALGLHLYHGIWSGLQTLGVANPNDKAWRRQLAAAIAIIVTVGNISIPVAVLAGIVKL